MNPFDAASPFDARYYFADRGFYALGLDGQKRQIDSLGSNVGHLLWSGIVEPARHDIVADELMGERLWSGSALAGPTGLAGEDDDATMVDGCCAGSAVRDPGVAARRG